MAERNSGVSSVSFFRSALGVLVDAISKCKMKVERKERKVVVELCYFGVGLA